MTSCTQAALDALAAGISVWPPRQDGSKAPEGHTWKLGQSERAGEAQILEWYRDGRTGVGWIAGKVSGDLEVLDFDDRSTWVEYQKLCQEAGVGHILERVKQGYLEHTPNGAHLVYRCSAVEGNQKLAQKVVSPTARKSLIETRGEGGYIIVAPSHGGVNVKGAYTLQSGGVASIAVLTPEERKALFDVARIFDEAPIQAESVPVRVSAAGRPGDDFNARASWADVLEPHGWRRVGSRLGVQSWRRPDKKEGISATTNHAGSDLLYVFSTSTVFESERGYSKFSAYALLEHRGDFGAAARALSLQGYGIEEVDEEVDLSGILAQRVAGPSRAKPAELAGLLRVPGLVGDVAEWIDASSVKLQPVLSVAASIAAVAALVGRKAKTSTGLRSNLYVLGVGETGCGKERARQAIGRLFATLGIDKTLGDSFASDSAVEAALAMHPSRLYLIDELGYFLGTMRDDLAPAHVKSIVPVLLRMYSSSDGTYRRRTYAQAELNENPAIDQPCLSLYGTTVPGNFYTNITKAHLSNGLLSRLLVFESQDPDPEMRWVSDDTREPPARLVEACAVWAARGYNSDPEAGNLEALSVADPIRVTETAGAVKTYTDLEATMRRRREEERQAGRDHGPYMRVTATALKLGLIRACGVNPERPEVTQADAEWGCALAWRLTEDFMDKVGDAAPENKVEEASQRVLSVVRRAGAISRQGLIRSTRFLSARQLDDVLKTLIEAGDVVLHNEQGPLGRPRSTYKLPGKESTFFPSEKVENSKDNN